MRRRSTVCFFAAALIAVGVPALGLRAQTPPPNPLEQIAWLVGGKWVADGDKGPDGKPFHVESQVRWGDNGRAIQFTTRFNHEGKLVPIYSGIYAWHPAKKKLVFLYTDNTGELTEGEATMDGDRLEQEFSMVGLDGVTRPFRSTIIRRGPDDYDWSVLREKDGAWTVMFALKYKRIRE
jgi:hypothetical protein